VQKCKALMIHCFVTEKRDGRIKARAVTDGRSQQRYTEEETYSPTVKLESIMLNAFIDAFEGRHVMTVDIKGAFLKAKVPEDMELMVKMTGELAQIMCKINPEMRYNEHGIIYLRCVKALYGRIKAARLFNDDLDHIIQHKLGFKQNQYDPCVFNKSDPMKDAEKVTIIVHIDDLKISSVSKDKLEDVVKQLESVYGEITVHQGNEHDYLGMILKYEPEKKNIILSMENYIRGILDEDRCSCFIQT